MQEIFRDLSKYGDVANGEVLLALHRVCHHWCSLYLAAIMVSIRWQCWPVRIAPDSSKKKASVIDERAWGTHPSSTCLVIADRYQYPCCRKFHQSTKKNMKKCHPRW